MSVSDKVPQASDRLEHMQRFRSREAWHVLKIMAEFVESTEALSEISPAVSIFGSARTPRAHGYYKLTEEIARRLSDAGFSVISGGGPGIMEAASKGAFFGKSPSVGLNIQLPHEQKPNEYQDLSLSFNHFFSRKVMFVKHAVAYVVMQPAAEQLKAALAGITFAAPQIDVINNIDVAVVHEGAAIADALYRQAFGPVRWVESVQALKARGITHVVECGPGKVLAGMVKRIDADLIGAALYDPATLAEVKELLA